MTVYSSWIAAVRSEAESRGGKAWTKGMLAAAKAEAKAAREDTKRPVLKPGEIFNPVTGEIVTGCVTIGALAASLGVTTDRLTNELERLRMVNRVLDYRDVPMICEPALRKPRYFHTPAPTKEATERGLALSISGKRQGRTYTLLLITPKGQDAVRTAFRKPAEPPKRTDKNREVIARLHDAGSSPAQIVAITAIPRRTVFRYLKAIRQAA